MAVAVRIWRVLSWIMGCLCVLPMGYGLWMQLALPEELLLFPVVMCALWFLSSVLAPISAVGIKRQTRWGRPAGWVTACVQIVAFPLFTPLGVFGLILLFLGAGKSGPQVDAKKRASGLASTVGGVAVVVGVVVPAVDGAFRWAKHLGYPEATSAIPTELILLLCLSIQMVVHEGGHALMGKLVGGHIHHFRIGPFWWLWESGRSWREFRPKTWGGASVGWTPGSADGLARQRLLVSGAGPLANLVTALFATVAFPFLGKLGLAHLWQWIMFCGVLGLAGLANLWPMRTGCQNSDGATVFGILTNPTFRRLTEILSFEGMSDSSALRPREWRRVDVEWLLGLEDVASQQSGILPAGCAHYLDSGDVTEAVACARRLHALAVKEPKRCSANSFPDTTFTLAFYGGDVDAARDLWGRRPRTAAQFDLAERLAEASISREDLSAAILRAWQCSERYGSSGTIEYLREQLRRLEIASLQTLPIATSEGLAMRETV